MDVYFNSNDAVRYLLAEVYQQGAKRDSRNGMTKELLNAVFSIMRPEQRFMLMPERHDNPFAKIAETMWVLAGRNDIEWLSFYLPRAADYSDDGKTWRGAYGARLRNWMPHDWTGAAIDQVKECVRLIDQDPDTRRAVITLFDPAIDYMPGKDIPCNNWIQWIKRDDTLFMTVAQRSSDIIWGLSGINLFEWSVLHELMALWTNSKIGRLTYLIGSLHLYEQHWERAEKILNAPKNSFYPDQVRFTTSFPEIDSELNRFFLAEQRLRVVDTSVDLLMASNLLLSVTDPAMLDYLRALNIFIALKIHTNPNRIVDELECIKSQDVKLAAFKYVMRTAGQAMKLA